MGIGLKSMIILGLVAVIAVSGAICCRNSPWKHKSRREERDERPPHVERVGPLAVKEVISGATILVEAGPRGRRQREIWLAGIAAPPPGDPLAEESRANLERQAGEKIWVEYLGRGILNRDQVQGAVYGPANEELQISQLRAGLARVGTPASPEYLAAENEARKAKRGVWAEPKGD